LAHSWSGEKPLLFFEIRDFSNGKRQRSNQARQHRGHGRSICDQEEPRTQTEKLSFKNTDPKVRKHVEFKEAKIK
jgi:ribosomal protein L33